MKDNKITFEDGQLVNLGYVEIDGVRHEVTEAEYGGNTPLSAHNLNLMQDNLRENIATNESNLGTDTDTYDSTKTYAVGNIVVYDNQLYKCITAVTTAEEFDITKWQKTSLKEMILELIILGNISNGQGSAQIGNLIGVEWGTISVTSSEEGTSAQGTTLYQASTTLNFKNTYIKTPRVLTNWGGAYTNQVYTFANYINATNCNIGGYVSSSNSTRTIAYLVIGQV